MNQIRIINLTSEKSKHIRYARYITFLNSSRDKRRESILFLNHFPVITAGVQYNSKNLLVSNEDLQNNNIECIQIRRGGDITAHEPGQLMIYIHVDLKKRNIKLSNLFHALLSITKITLSTHWKIQCKMNNENSGLYIGSNKKIASIGMDSRKFFTAHGLALNIYNDFSTFEYIRACGLSHVKQTSVANEIQNFYKTEEFIKLWTNKFNEFLNNPIASM